jgi:hypothetical protein
MFHDLLLIGNYIPNSFVDDNINSLIESCNNVFISIPHNDFEYKLPFKNTYISTELDEMCDISISLTSEEYRKWMLQTCLNKLNNKISDKFIVYIFDEFIKYTELVSILEHKIIIPKSIGYLFIPNDETYTYNTVDSSLIYFTDNISYTLKDLINSDISDNILFVVPSVINIIAQHQNIYTIEERYHQTLTQVKTIKKYYPKSTILLCEASDKIPMKYLYNLSKYAKVWYITEKEERYLYNLANNTNNKNKYEVYLMDYVLSFIKQNDLNPSHFAKFGGRYWFHKKNEFLFQNEPVMIKSWANCYNQYIIEPVFYSSPIKYINEFIKMYKNMEYQLEIEFTDVERMLYTMFYSKNNNVRDLVKAGIMGYSAAGIYRYF